MSLSPQQPQLGMKMVSMAVLVDAEGLDSGQCSPRGQAGWGRHVLYVAGASPLSLQERNLPDWDVS